MSPPEALALGRISAALVAAERALCLLDRCLPRNLTAELAATLDAFERGHERAPSFRYGPPPSGELARLLELAARAVPGGLRGELLRGRAEELALEVELAAAVGTPGFAPLAARRFPAPAGDVARRAVARARDWSGAAPVPVAAERIPADDRRDPRSLVRVVEALLERERLAVRVLVREQLASAAATGDGVVVVRAADLHTPREAERIALHEVMGHALPRARGASDPTGLGSAGTSGSAEHEEGRALLLEQRAGLLDEQRRRELAQRHLAALAVRAGATFVDAVRELRAHGASVGEAVRVVARVGRGGGLCREIAYLPSLDRVEQAFAADPPLERWLARGRFSLDAARRLERAERGAQANVAITGV